MREINYKNEPREEQVALYPYLRRAFFAGILPAHAGFVFLSPSLGHPTVSLCQDTSKVGAGWPTVQL